MKNTQMTIEIPNSVENLQLPDPSLINFFSDVENRVIWFDREIDDSYVEYQKYILRWNQEDEGKPVTDRKPIKCFFYTPGGDLYMTISMVSVIKMSKTPVIGINMGMAYSGGLFMFQACHKRLSIPGATFLFHRGSASDVSGTQQQVESFSKHYKQIIERSIEEFRCSTSISKASLARKKDKEWFFDATEAVELGVVQQIVTDIEEIM